MWVGVFELNVSPREPSSGPQCTCLHTLFDCMVLCSFLASVSMFDIGNGLSTLSNSVSRSLFRSKPDSNRWWRVLVVDPRPQLCETSTTDSSGMVTTCVQGRRLSWPNLTVVAPSFALPQEPPRQPLCQLSSGRLATTADRAVTFH